MVLVGARQMTAIDVAKMQRESDDGECKQCGQTLVSDEIKFCEGCCSHKNTEVRPLLGEKCHDCGMQVSDDE